MAVKLRFNWTSLSFPSPQATPVLVLVFRDLTGCTGQNRSCSALDTELCLLSLVPPRPCSLGLSHLHLPAIPWLSQSSLSGNFVFIFLSVVLLHHRCGWLFLIFSGPSSNVSSWSNPYISLLTYWTKVTWYGREELNLASWRVHSNPEAVTVLWRATGPFIPLSEIEYNGNFQDQYSHPCQDTMVPARCTGYTRLMSKTKCHVKFPGFLDFRGTYREARSSLNVSQPQGVHGPLKN